jgi:dTDP-4-amino-4,6-dideoxygalactose transaminase
MFYLVCENLSQRTDLIKNLKENKINSVFHYLSLHDSPYFKENHDGRILENSDHFSDSLLRLPLYFELSEDQVDLICEKIIMFFKK